MRTAPCRFTQNVVVQSVTRHTHRWGTEYSVWFAGGARDGEHIWTSESYAEDTYRAFDEPVVLAAGEGFRFQCSYENTETYPLRFGPKATDEMCILFSILWAAAESPELAPQECNITRIDADGVGRPIDTSSFPEPTAEQVSICQEASGYPPACQECACRTCGASVADCVDDAECRPIYGCIQSTGCDFASCPTACADAITAHTGGTAKLIDLGTCLSAACPACAGNAEGGAP